MNKIKLIFKVVTITFLLQNILFAQTNLLTNGDFSSGNTGFTSNYTFCNTTGCMGACGCPPQYAVGTSAVYYHGALTGFDHTTGKGNFLIADGGVSAVTVWKQTVPVDPNTDYSFSLWLSSIYNSSPASIQVLINGVDIASPFTAPENLNTWIQCSASWNSGSDISATIDIIDLNTTFVGNDFGLDDISFTQSCNSLDSFICDVAPKLNEIDAGKSSDVSVTFSQDMNSSTINSSNIKVFGFQTGFKSSSISYNAGTRTAAINPNSDFKVGEKIQVTLSSGILTSSSTPITPFVWTFTVQALSGTGTFTEARIIDSVNLNISQPGVEIKSGDVDGDGDIDLLTIGYFTGIEIYENGGYGNFSLLQQINSLPGVEHYAGFYTGDFDNDGDLDFTLAIATFTTFLDSLYTFKNDGSGYFTKSSAAVGGGLAGSAADLDGDGDLDLSLTWAFDKVRYYINDGSGNFTNHLIEDLGYYHTNGCQPGDLDNDGDLDIFVSIKDFDDTHCKFISLLNDGNANFSIGTTYFTDQYFDDQKLADINGDNNLDIVGRNYHYFSLGNNSFYQTTFSGGSQAIPFDFDGDGDIDLAFSNYPSDDVKFYKNNGTGSFNNSSNATLGQYTTGGATGDFDNDGDIDLAINNVYGHNGISDISILMNDYQIVTCNVKVAIEGFYNLFSNKHSARDTVRAYLRNVTTPFAIVDSAKAVIDSATLTVSFEFITAPSGTYYIQLNHRNSIETWSKSGGEQLAKGNTSNYNFTASASQAYGNNLTHIGSKYCIYSGDIDQNGIADLSDGVFVYNDAVNFTTGYVNSDVDGDSSVDLSDLLITYRSSRRFVALIRP